MAKFKNKETRIINGEEAMFYADIVIQAFNAPVKEGITISEMRKDMKLIEKFETVKKNKEVELELEEAKRALELFEALPWNVRHPDIVSVYDHLEELTK